MHRAILAATLLAIAGSAPAAAESRTVRYDDLDLTTARGAARLDRRIAAATEQVCGSYAAVPHDEEDAITACRRAAMARYHARRTELIPAASRLAAR